MTAALYHQKLQLILRIAPVSIAFLLHQGEDGDIGSQRGRRPGAAVIVLQKFLFLFFA